MKDKIYYYNEDQTPGLYFSLVKVTDENVGFWRDYKTNDRKCKDQASKYIEGLSEYKQQTASTILKNIYEGQAGFEVKHGIDKNAEQWVMVASNKPITDPNNIDHSSLEMIMMVTTSENSPFTTHMGISRTYTSLTKDNSHKNISPMMHAFASKIMKTIYPDKIYMIHSPLPGMCAMTINEFKKHNIKDAMFFPEETQGYKSKLESSNSEVKNFEEQVRNFKEQNPEKEISYPAKVHLQTIKNRLIYLNEACKYLEDVKLNQDFEKIVLLDKVEKDKYNKDIVNDTQISIYGPDKKLLCEFNKSTPEYKWFTGYGNMGWSISKYVGYDLDKLSQLREIDSNKIFNGIDQYKTHLLSNLLNNEDISLTDALKDSQIEISAQAKSKTYQQTRPSLANILEDNNISLKNALKGSQIEMSTQAKLKNDQKTR